MKLAKLSLAAIVAAGSFSMANAAVSLEEAIKDVEVSGMVRYRLDGDRIKTKGENKFVETHKNANKFRVDFGTGIKLDENFKINFGIRYYAVDGNGKQTSTIYDANGDVVSSPSVPLTLNAQSTKKDGTDLLVRDINLAYANEDKGTTIKAGRQALDTLYTAGIIGDGVVATQKVVPGVTLAAFYVANLDANDGDNNLVKVPVVKDGKIVKGETEYFHKPIYGLGVLTNFDFVTADLWGAMAQDTAMVYGLDAGLDLKLDDSMKVTAKAQVSQTDVDSAYKDALKDSTNYNVNAGFDMGIFNAKVGYASTGTKKGDSLVTLHDSGRFETMGEILMGFNDTDGQTQYIYAGIGGKLDAYSAGFEYVNASTKFEGQSDKAKANEYLVRLGYKYNEKLNFSGYYAFADYKDATEQNQYRIEAKYSF